MVVHSGDKTDQSRIPFEPLDIKLTVSKSSVISKIPDVNPISKRLKCSSSKKNLRARSKTSEGTNLNDQNNSSNDKSASASNLMKNWSIEKNNKSEMCLNKMEEDKTDYKPTAVLGKRKTLSHPEDAQKECLESQKKLSESGKGSNISTKNVQKNNPCGIRKPENPNELTTRRPSEIPKLKFITETCYKKNSKINMTGSKLPIKTIPKEPESKQDEAQAENKNSEKTTSIKSSKTKKAGKEKVKQALTSDFTQLVPLYQKELRKISDIWVNTIYSSLTMRTNLVKLLFQAFPCIDRTQFQTEDEKLLYCIAHTKSNTKSEAENLILFIRSLLANHEKAKEDYKIKMENKEIAQAYNYDWREITKKIVELGEYNKQIQMEIPELLKRKEDAEANGNEKIQKLESNLVKKSDEIQKLCHQLDILKQRENSCKGNVFLKIEDYKDIKADVASLLSMQKEYEELKAKYMYQNDIYEKKIKNLEILLDEKKKILEKEAEVKKQLQTFLNQLQTQRKHLNNTIGKEQLDYVLGRLNQGREKRREQLWVIAIKLVLKGFLIQLKKLERDRNKMLLELHSNDLENFNTFANTIIQKENFIKTIKHQTEAYYKASMGTNTNNLEKSCDENHKK